MIRAEKHPKKQKAGTLAGYATSSPQGPSVQV
jgi:hypothetical protein